MRANLIELRGQLVELSPVRVTPAGVRVIGGVIDHRSQQDEAGSAREVLASVPFVAVGRVSDMIAAAKLGAEVAAKGFIAAKSLKSKRLVLHVTEIEFVEGN